MKKIFKLFTLSLLFFASCTMTVAEDIVAKEYFETTNISKISTDLTYENLSVETTNGNEILIEIASNYSKMIPEFYVEDDTFVIKSKKKRFWNPGYICNVYLYLPTDFFPTTTELNTASGEVFIEDLETDELTVKSASGDIKVLFSNAKDKITLSAASGEIEFETGNTTKFSAKTASGDILIKQLTSNEIICDAVSGEITTQEIECEYLSCETTSGDIDCSKTVCQYFDIKAVSGSVDLELENQIEAESSIKTTSGSVDLVVPEDMNFEIIANSSSGKFEDDINGRTYRPRDNFESKYNEGGITILIDTTSGSIELESN